MDFTLCPNTGPPRIIRFVEYLGKAGLVAMVSPVQNVLLVNKEIYDTLDDLGKQLVLTAREPMRFRLLTKHAVEIRVLDDAA
jgi:hypothetical protein